jgi:alpha-1,2-mannosyltransferase
VKLTPLVFVPFLFLVRSTRAAWAVLATFAACGVLMAVLAPRESWQYWTHDIVDSRRIGRTFSFNNQSVAGVIERFHHAAVPAGVALGAELLLGVGGIAVAVWAHRTSSPLLGVLVCATTGLMVSPITWSHHLVWVVPVLAWLVLADDRPAGGAVWAAAGFALFWWAPNWHAWARGPAPFDEHGLQLVGGNGPFFAMVLFVGGVSVLLATRRRALVTAGGPASEPGR